MGGLQLPLGKVDPTILKSIVFKYLGFKRDDVIVGPMIGGDAAAIRVGDEILVLKTDPIIGARKRLGWLSVNIVSNDIACLGAQPIALTLTILLPEGATVDTLREIMEEADKAAKSLGIAIVGGHTEVAIGLKGRPPIVVASAIGKPVVKGKIIKPNGAKPGDLILMSKSVGLEGTAILAEEFKDKLINKISPDTLNRALKMYMETSVLKEAIELTKLGIVHAMHDPTDGGLLEGLYEMAEASKLGFKVWEDRVNIEPETLEICKALNVDPLKLISSGVLLAAIPKSGVEMALETLKKIGVKASIIGEFVDYSRGRKVYRVDGSLLEVKEPAEDELWKVLKI